MNNFTNNKIVPEKYGLSNSEPIIPPYYIKTLKIISENGKQEEIKYMDVKYIDIIKDDIRNLRKLNDSQKQYIKFDLDEKTKNEIIDLFINIFCVYSDIIAKL